MALTAFAQRSSAARRSSVLDSRNWWAKGPDGLESDRIGCALKVDRYEAKFRGPNSDAGFNVCIKHPIPVVPSMVC